jgi:nucleolar protein 15
MHAYFSQFGDILHLRLSRNKKTGASRHYAFIEFASMAVAKIVAATMNKYLLFSHILQVRVVPPEQVHPDLFKGAGRRFKVIPRNKLEGEKLARGTTREAWKKRIETESKRRSKKAEKLKALGYEFEAPDLMDIDAVPVQGQQQAEDGEAKETSQAEAEADETPKAIEAKKDTIEDVLRTTQASPGVVEVTEKVKIQKAKSPKGEKAKKTRKAKA